MVPTRRTCETGRTTKRKVCTITSRNTSSWVCPVDFDGRREMLSLSLKTVVVHKSVTSLMTVTNLHKEGKFIRFRILNLRRNCKNCFGVYACCFVNINTATYFNLFLCQHQGGSQFWIDQKKRQISAASYLFYYNFCL